MSDFDDELKQFFRREEPPAGFAESVLARIASEREAPRRRPPLYGLAAAATVLVALGLAVWGVTLSYRVERGSIDTTVLAPSASVQPNGVSHPPVVEPTIDPPLETAPGVTSTRARHQPAPIQRIKLATRRAARPTPVDAEAEHAKEQLVYALRLASTKLATAQRKVLESQGGPLS